MNILGLNTYFEHPAVALICDGELAFACEDERFTRIKHGRRYTPFSTYLPVDAIHAALKYCGLKSRDIQALSCSYSSGHHLSGLLSCITGQRVSSLYEELNGWLAQKNLRNSLCTDYAYSVRTRNVICPSEFRKIRLKEWPHHDCHAASSFFCSGFEKALTIVCDGAGELDSTSVYSCNESSIRKISRMEIPNSLGLFYTGVTEHIGFEPFSDEFKVMGLASYGKPVYEEQLATILPYLGQGKYSLNMKAMENLTSLVGPPRNFEEDITEQHMNIAKSAQLVLEKTLLSMISYFVELTGHDKLCLAGGIFMNSVANGTLSTKSLVDEIFIQPAAHDAGTAIGAAALSYGGHIRTPNIYLGTEYSDTEILKALQSAGLSNFEFLDEKKQIDILAEELSEGKICALFRGRMEFGSRSLGHRSILASPVDSKMKDRLNKIKGREDFRPVAPMVTEAAFGKYFDGEVNEHMMFTVHANSYALEHVPACVHVDGSARPQVVRENFDFLHSLINRFGQITEHPVILNTSFNTRGEPIVESPTQALASFFTTELDIMLIGSYLLRKRNTL